MTRTPTNPQIIATIEKGILLKKRLANPSIPFDTPVFANVAAAFAAAMNDYTSALLFRASELAARGDSAVQQLMHHWKMTEEEVNGRLQQIADANPGGMARMGQPHPQRGRLPDHPRLLALRQRRTAPLPRDPCPRRPHRPARHLLGAGEVGREAA